jgi:hypothetical protein
MRNTVLTAFVVPAQAGTQWLCNERRWIPAFAGMTGSWGGPR